MGDRRGDLRGGWILCLATVDDLRCTGRTQDIAEASTCRDGDDRRSAPKGRGDRAWRGGERPIGQLVECGMPSRPFGALLVKILNRHGAHIAEADPIREHLVGSQVVHVHLARHLVACNQHALPDRLQVRADGGKV